MADLSEFLKAARLEKYGQALQGIGVECVQDLEYVCDEDLCKMGLTQIERRRFDAKRKEFLGTPANDLSANTVVIAATTATTPNITAPPPDPHVLSPTGNLLSKTSAEATLSPLPAKLEKGFYLRYQVVQQLYSGSVKVVTHLNAHSTLENLIQAICHQERLSGDLTIEPYAPEGYSLSPDKESITKTLQEWQLVSGSFIWVVVRRRGELDVDEAALTLPKLDPNEGPTQIFVRASNSSTTINVNLHVDNARTLKQKIYSKKGIPTSMQKLNYGGKMLLEDNDASLITYGIQAASTIHMWSFPHQSGPSRSSASSGWTDNFTFHVSCQPLVVQTNKAMAIFSSALYVVSTDLATKGQSKYNKVLGHVRRLTGCAPLVAALQYLFRRRLLSSLQKLALAEGLYQLFRALLPRNPSEVSKDVSVGDDRVFEASAILWAFLIEKAKDEDGTGEEYKDFDLTCCLSMTRMTDPVRVSGTNAALMDRAKAVEFLEDGKDLPGGVGRTVTAADLQSDPITMRLLLCTENNVRDIGIWSPSNIAMVTEALVVSNPSAHVPWSHVIVCRNNINMLKVTPTLSLKGQPSVPLMTIGPNGTMCVYTGLCKDVNKPANLFDPITGDTDSHNIDELAVKVRKFDEFGSAAGKEFKLGEEQITRPPKEAVVVVLDISWSMDDSCFNGDMTRLQTVKQLFHAFANRSMAYNMPHVIGLICFGSQINVVSRFTELFINFKDYVDGVSTNGRTKLYDALLKAGELLKELGERFPECKRRIFALTDGEDNESTTSADVTAMKLQENRVVVDSVLVGPGNETLKAISIATGGCSFFPDSIAQALKLFEMETVLSLRARATVNVRPTVTSKSQLKRYMKLPYDTQPAHHAPADLNRPVSSTGRVLRKACMAPPSGGAVAAPHRTKRLLREIAAYQKDPHPQIEIYPCEDRLSFWRLLLVGPEDTPYAGGVFLLYATFPEEYPSLAPEIRFVTPIYHCNVNSSGRICHSVFDRNYTTDTNVKVILSCVYGLLLEPEPDDPLDSTLAEEYFSNRVQYDRNAQAKTSFSASKSLDQWRKELLGTDADDDSIPSNLKCPLTLQIFEDPVMTPYGHTYERSAIEAHIAKKNNDPLTRKPLELNDLVPNRAIKEMVKTFQQMMSSTWWD